MAQVQRQWVQAAQHYREALSIFVEFNDRHAQASTYHQLGVVAEGQRQWAQREQHYHEALKIKIEFNDRYAQASTYHQLGMVAEGQRQWAQAREHYLRAMETFVTYNDVHNAGVVLRSLARLWQASGDADLPAAIAPLVGSRPEEGGGHATRRSVRRWRCQRRMPAPERTSEPERARPVPGGRDASRRCRGIRFRRVSGGSPRSRQRGERGLDGCLALAPRPSSCADDISSSESIFARRGVGQ
jgi:uncharacterized protein HemY